jgi:hypothetical protein
MPANARASGIAGGELVGDGEGLGDGELVGDGGGLVLPVADGLGLTDDADGLGLADADGAGVVPALTARLGLAASAFDQPAGYTANSTPAATATTDAKTVTYQGRTARCLTVLPLLRARGSTGPCPGR